MAVGRAGMAVGRRTRPEGAHHAGRARGRRANARCGERLLDRADDQPAHEAGIAETHVGLGRMDVDVDQCRIERQEKHCYGVAVARQHVGEGAADRAGDQLVAHRTAVDIGILLQRVGAGVGRDRDVAGKRHAFARGVDGNRIVGEVRAHDLGDAAQAPFGGIVGRGQVERGAVGARKCEADGQGRRWRCA